MSEQNRIGLQFENKPGELPSRLDLPLLVYRSATRNRSLHTTRSARIVKAWA